MILAASNKKASATSMAAQANAYLQSHGLSRDYIASPSPEYDLIIISEKATGAPVCEVSMKTEKEDTVRYGFRKATKKDIDEGKQLYVRYKHPSTTDKQIPEVDSIKNIVDILTR